MCTAMMFSAAKLSSSHIFVYISSIEYTFPLFCVKNFKILYSVGVSFTSLPSTTTFFNSSSIVKFPAFISPAFSDKTLFFEHLLIIAFTLAINSSGLNGFVI